MAAAVEWGRPFPMEERSNAILVRPIVNLDPAGGFLVADGAEGQVRRYAPTGKLLWQVGRKGGGPGEYQQPVAVIRLNDGRYVVVDNRGRFTILGDDGAYLRDFTVPFTRVEGTVALQDNRILVFGVSPDAEPPEGNPLLHIVDISQESIQQSLFPLPYTGRRRALDEMMGYAQADVRGDTIVAAYGGMDSVFIFGLDGRQHRAFRIPVANFRLATAIPEDFGNPMRRAEWLSSFETIGGVWWVGADLIAVAYKTVVPGGMKWHWAIMTRTGELVHSQEDSGRVLTTYADRPTILMTSPRSVAPNVWQEATIRF
jgi:hypothetical protein